MELRLHWSHFVLAPSSHSTSLVCNSLRSKMSFNEMFLKEFSMTVFYVGSLDLCGQKDRATSLFSTVLVGNSAKNCAECILAANRSDQNWAFFHQIQSSSLSILGNLPKITLYCTFDFRFFSTDNVTRCSGVKSFKIILLSQRCFFTKIIRGTSICKILLND